MEIFLSTEKRYCRDKQSVTRQLEDVCANTTSCVGKRFANVINQLSGAQAESAPLATCSNSEEVHACIS